MKTTCSGRIDGQTGRGAGGFTLIEVAIALVILGITAGAAIYLYRVAHEQRQVDVTRDRMATITEALSIFAETTGRLPCPADPGAVAPLFGHERGVTAAQLRVSAGKFPSGTCNSWIKGSANFNEGIVPFLALDIPPEMVRDGWGNYFTYAVSPVFAQGNDQAGQPGDASFTPGDTGLSDDGDVHGRCRSFGWIDKDTGRTINAVKARFCCAARTAGLAKDIVILHTAGNTIVSPTRVGNTVDPNTGKNRYISLNSVAAKSVSTPDGPMDVPVPDRTIVEAPAFVLISHGNDGLGAYIGNNAQNKFGTTVGLDLENANNAGDDSTYRDGPINATSGTAHFDDIVRWLTQDGVMAAHGALSCSYP